MRSFATLLAVLLLFLLSPALDNSEKLSVKAGYSPKTAASSDFELSSVEEFFPQKGLQTRIDFWRTVYSRYDRRQVIIHDRENLAIIYKVLKFDKFPDVSPGEWRDQESEIEAEVLKVQNALEDFSKFGLEAAGFSSTHKHVHEALVKAGQVLDAGYFRDAPDRVREQRGVKDRFEQGVVRSGLYLPYIVKVFRDKGLPEELAYLPHVESSFNYASYSKVGAAGIWQFMRRSSRGLLTINSVMDERRDPLRATQAAAEVLWKNYNLLRSWPQAITAYNYGTNGMMRANEAQQGDFLAILEKHDGKAFGFASKNFYSEFLAALEVAKNCRKYFPLAEMAKPLKFEELKVKSGNRSSQLAELNRVSEGTLRAYNPAISIDIHRGYQRLPSGYMLKVPAGEIAEALSTLSREEQNWMSRVAPVKAARSVRKGSRRSIHTASLRHDSRKSKSVKAGSKQYRVRKGETLTQIAKKLKVSPAALKKRNKRLASGQVFAGQVLLLP
jgi:membrane-bound lytic murein transglycosylase D